MKYNFKDDTYAHIRCKRKGFSGSVFTAFVTCIVLSVGFINGSFQMGLTAFPYSAADLQSIITYFTTFRYSLERPKQDITFQSIARTLTF